MGAVRIQVVVPEDRQLTITLPPQVAPGAAEVIVLTSGPGGEAGATALFSISWTHGARNTHSDAARGRSTGTWAEERDSWTPGW